MEREEWDSEEVWQSWLDTHNKIAEEAVGRYARKKRLDERRVGPRYL